MRKPGDWYTYMKSVEIGGDGMLMSCTGNGSTVEGAIEDHWSRVTSIQPSKYLVVRAMRGDRKHFRWSGFMWTELPLPEKR